jgi:hypothetical protein
MIGVGGLNTGSDNKITSAITINTDLPCSTHIDPVKMNQR